MTRYNDALTRR